MVGEPQQPRGEIRGRHAMEPTWSVSHSSHAGRSEDVMRASGAVDPLRSLPQLRLASPPGLEPGAWCVQSVSLILAVYNSGNAPPHH